MKGRTTVHTILAKIKMTGKWEYGRSNGKGKVKEVLASERMDRKEVRKDYRRLREGKATVGKGMSVNDVFSVFKGVVTTVAAEVVRS